MTEPALVAEPLVPFRAELGEGPIWDYRTGRLVWVDILAGLVHATVPTSGTTTSIPIGKQVGAVALCGSSSYLLAVRDGFALLEGEGLGPTEAAFHDPVLRMNDGAVDPAGRFLAGSMAYDRTKGAAALHARDVDGSIRTVLSNVTLSNGLAWSASGDTMYYIDSGTRRVDAFDYDVERGEPSNRRPLVTFEPADGTPDGMTIDAEGCLWVALYRGGEVRRYSPEGVLLARVEVAAAQVTSCAFGGEDLGTLFVTTACQELDLSDPANRLAGHLFAVDPSCRGRREPLAAVAGTPGS
jgi:sugar lactone lactonase YvrE